MILDHEISSTPALVVLLAGIIVAGLVEPRWNPRPPLERYLNDPDDWPAVALWNMFSTRKWTAEGITFHERRMLFTVGVTVYFVVGYILLDWIW